MVITIKVQERGVITLPKHIRELSGLSEGTLIDITQEGETVVLRPVARLHPELLADVTSALEDLRTGNVSPAFRSGAELEAYMQKHRARAKRIRKA